MYVYSSPAKRVSAWILVVLWLASILSPLAMQATIQPRECEGLELPVVGGHDYPLLLPCDNLLIRQNALTPPETPVDRETLPPRLTELPEPISASVPAPTLIHPMTGEYYVTGVYGERCDVLGVYVGCLFHDGFDLGNSLQVGQPTVAVSAGKVSGVYSFSGPYPCLGHYVFLQRSDGITFVYGHLNATNLTHGQEIALGDVVGEVGSSGCSTGPHLHLGVYSGDPILGIHQDPAAFFAGEGVTLDGN